MLAKVAFPYKAMVVPPKCREARQAQYMAETTVEIQEVAPADAPVAFRVRDPADASGHQLELLWKDGKVWWPLRIGDEKLNIAIPSNRWLAQLARGNQLAGEMLGLEVDLPYDVTKWQVKRIEEEALKRTDSTEQDTAAANAHRLAAQTMICGGSVYVAGPDPVYRIVRRHGPGGYTSLEFIDWRAGKLPGGDGTWYGSHEAMRDTMTEGDFDLAEAGMIFRADRLQDAIDRLGPGGRIEAAIDILIPEAVTAEPVASHICGAAGEFGNYVGQDRELTGRCYDTTKRAKKIQGPISEMVYEDTVRVRDIVEFLRKCVAAFEKWPEEVKEGLAKKDKSIRNAYDEAVYALERADKEIAAGLLQRPSNKADDEALTALAAR